MSTGAAAASPMPSTGETLRVAAHVSRLDHDARGDPRRRRRGRGRRVGSRRLRTGVERGDEVFSGRGGERGRGGTRRRRRRRRVGRVSVRGVRSHASRGGGTSRALRGEETSEARGGDEETGARGRGPRRWRGGRVTRSFYVVGNGALRSRASARCRCRCAAASAWSYSVRGVSCALARARAPLWMRDVVFVDVEAETRPRRWACRVSGRVWSSGGQLPERRALRTSSWRGGGRDLSGQRSRMRGRA